MFFSRFIAVINISKMQIKAGEISW